MSRPLFFTIFATEAGWMGLVGSEVGLKRVILPCPAEGEVRHAIGNDAIWAAERFGEVVRRFQHYFAGERVDFPVGLDLGSATPFQRSVWEVTRLIPYGRTASYKWVAAQTGNGRAARAVGQALSQNPLPVIIPCHRVLMADGRLGGFRGGLSWKQFLLRLECYTGVDSSAQGKRFAAFECQ